MDVIKFTKMLNSSVMEIKNLPKEEEESADKAYKHLRKLIPTFTQGNRELQNSSFEEIKSSASSATELAQVQLAIHSFLKTAEKRTGAIQAALFEDPEFKKFTAKLLALSRFLKGKEGEKNKVQGASLDEL